MARRIVIEFLGKDRGVGSTAAKVESKTSRLGDTFKKVGKAAAVGMGVAAVAVGKLAFDAIGSASDLNETLNKSQVIFGKQAPAMEKWANTAWKSAGLSKQAALEAAAGFGDMFSQLGFAGGEAAKMSKNVVQLSADLGSFNNLPTAEVADMMSAAFRGEYDSLQRLIPNINAARVESEALEMTGKKLAKNLTSQEKAAATLAIVQRDGARAAGDFARTSDGLANQQKILAARFENAKASLGQKLLPVAVKFTNWLNDDAIPGASKFARGLSGTFGPAMEKARAVARSVLGWLRKNFRGSFKDIKSIAQNALVIIRTLWSRWGDDVIRIVKGAAKLLAVIIKGALKIISGIVKVFAGVLRGDWRKAWDGVKDILRGASTIVKALVRAMFAVVRTLVSAGGRMIVDAIRGIPGKLRALGGLFGSAGRALIQAFVNGMRNAAGIISGIAGNVWSAVRSLLNGAISRINSALSFTINLPGPDLRVNVGIPYLAKGGVVRARPGGTLALLGEGGHDEAVVPLSGPHAPKMAGAGTLQVVINFNGLVTDPRAAAREIHRLLLAEKRLTGKGLGLA